MKKFKKLASLVIAASMLTSSFVFAGSANAVEKDVAPQAAFVDASIQKEVGDGVILHAFNWSYNSIKENLPAIAAAGYSTVQTSPVQQPKDYGVWMDVANQWWKLYQPVSMSLAEQTWLGTKEELSSLCKEADKYGIKIICDIVSNHMGNVTDGNPNVSDQVNTYQPDFYENKDTYFHNLKSGVSDSSAQKTVQGWLGELPDLNTGNKNVQDAVISLLKECIDCGVDGFRFDAAKHIETPDDGEYASDYWPNITDAASSYYKAKTGNNLYIYGEILNNCGTGRSYDSYTKYINVTDNITGDSVLFNVVKGRATSATNPTYKTGQDASDLVIWAESHDTFEGESGAGGMANTANVSNSDIVKAWAIVAARKDATALYFARPGSALMGEASDDISYKSTAVSEINKFHNKFVGEDERLGAADDVAYVARGTNGIVLSNCAGNEKSVSISGTGLADGSYIDTITGNEFTVENGVLVGSIGSTGVAVVYDGTTTPKNICSVESGDFYGDTMTVTLGLENATSGTYCLRGGTPVAYDEEITIRIGEGYSYGETINLTLTATDGKNDYEMTYKYTKNEAASSGVYLFFNSEKRTNWEAPFNIYIFDEKTSSEETYSNAAWPGVPMQFDEATGYYYYEVPSNSCLATNTETGAIVDSAFDLAHSANSCAIFSDCAGNQFPGQNSKTPIYIGSSSKIFALTKTNSWEDTDLVPSLGDEQPATDVVRPEGDVRIYGDADGDGKINILDVTHIQKHLALLVTISDEDLELCDVDESGKVNILDCTTIQKYLAKYEDSGVVGEIYVPEMPTKPSIKPTQPTTKPTQPSESTEPSESEDEYTLYFKTYLGWMTDLGTSLFAYDTATGLSYQFVKDTDAFPEVYTIDVPNETSSVIIYRSLKEIEETPTTENAYNVWTAEGVSPVNNCIYLDNDEKVTVCPYVAEEKPEWSLDRVYFDNTKSKWSEVYVHGWGETGLGGKAVKMEQIEGTNIWYFDFDEPILPGAKCFLFKNTPDGSWVKQTNDVTIVENMNCCVGSSSKSYTWSNYEE